MTVTRGERRRRRRGLPARAGIRPAGGLRAVSGVLLRTRRPRRVGVARPWHRRGSVRRRTSGPLARAASEALRAMQIADGGAAPVAVGALPFDDEPRLDVGARRTVRRDRGRGDLAARSVPAEAVSVSAFLPERVIGDLPHEAFRPMQLTRSPRRGLGTPRSSPRRSRASKRASSRRSCSRGRSASMRAARSMPAGCCIACGRSSRTASRSRRPSRGGVLVGASPELAALAPRDLVRSTPLAGTAPRVPAIPTRIVRTPRRSLASAKDREEHAIVVEAVAEVLGGLCDDLALGPGARARAHRERLAPRHAVRG